MNAILKTSGKVLLSKAFFINLAVILVITAWVPLLSQTVEMRDSDGNLLHQATTTSRAYESWWIVVRMAPGAKSHAKAVTLHFCLCFAISFGVWFIRLHSLREDAPDTGPGGEAANVGDDTGAQ